MAPPPQQSSQVQIAELPLIHDPIRTLLRRLHEAYDLSDIALTGSFAAKLHIAAPFHRKIGDIDLVAAALYDVPAAWNHDLLCLHVHPRAAEGHLLAQFLDPETSLMIDVFRERGTAMTRTERRAVDGHDVRLIAAEDLLANTLRLLSNLARGETVPGKHAADFKNLRNLVDYEIAELIWPEYRRSSDPRPFADAVRRTRALIQDQRHLLVRQPTKTLKECSKCHDTFRFQTASPEQAVTALRGA